MPEPEGKTKTQHEVMKLALETALVALEEYAVAYDREYGAGRSLQELEEQGRLPGAILAVRSALKQGDLSG